MIHRRFPLFPLTCVGSFPKPDYLLQARRAYAKEEISAEGLAAAEQKATCFWLEFQEHVGLDLLVDGEQYRGDMVAYFAEHLSGFSDGGLVESYGNRFYKKPVIVEKVCWTRSITVDHFRFAQQATTKPVKAIVTGPYTMYHWSFDDYYPSKEEALQDLAHAVRQEVLALTQAGATFIQIDEPAMSAVPEDFPLVKRGWKRLRKVYPQSIFSRTSAMDSLIASIRSCWIFPSIITTWRSPTGSFICMIFSKSSRSRKS